MQGKVVALRQPSAREPQLSDEALALACASGDAAAVAELFDRFRGTVTRFLSHMVGSAPDVEDLLQATFLEVARGQAKFEARSTVSTWLIGIAANMARHHRRSMGRQRRLQEAYEGEHGLTLPVVHDHAFEEQRALARLQQGLLALPDERRAAFVLCELEGLGAKEAAQALGCSETAIWKRVSDARRELRRAIAEGAP